MDQPTKEQIARFIDCFDTLGQHDAMMQMVRGSSAFDRAKWPDMPDPSVVAVKVWLCDLAGVTPKHT